MYHTATSLKPLSSKIPFRLVRVLVHFNVHYSLKYGQTPVLSNYQKGIWHKQKLYMNVTIFIHYFGQVTCYVLQVQECISWCLLYIQLQGLDCAYP